jgi:hypothetical protein
MNGFRVDAAVREAFAGWSLGFIEIEGLSPREAPGATPGGDLEREVLRVEEGLKARFGGLTRKEIAGSEPARAYEAYFAAAGKAFPVLLQADAVANKGRRIAMPDPLVKAMFAAELESMILTAGHDLDSLRRPLALGLADGMATMPTLGGAIKVPPRGDLVMRDGLGVFASVLLGPDDRTSIGPAAGRVAFVAYAAPGIRADAVRGHLRRLAELAALACPGAAAAEARVLALAP